jgi:uncharacterized OB-fold protein
VNPKAAELMQMRGDGLASTVVDNPIFEARIELPYTLTTGRAAATFLAELANRKIVGSRCPKCGDVTAPAQDFCAACGETQEDFVEVPAAGTLSGFTETASGLLGLIRLDGTDVDFVHKLLDAELDGLEIGQRVAARWADEAEGSILDLAGFAPDAEAPQGEVTELQPGAEPILEQRYRLQLDYNHSYGPYYGTLFDGLASSRRLQGVRCPSCKSVLVPPREYCDVCYVRTAEWVDVADTGVIKAFSVIHLEFVGQVREPPYVYAEIVLDGAATRLIHTIGGIDVDEARDRLQIGMPVRAVWKDGSDPVGSLADIEHFEPIFEDR